MRGAIAEKTSGDVIRMQTRVKLGPRALRGLSARTSLTSLRKFEFVRFHIHLAAAEAHAFGFEPESLFHGRIAAQLDLAASAEDALPGQSETVAQNGNDLARCSRKSGSTSYATVGRNSSAWDRANGALDLHAEIRACLSRRPFLPFFNQGRLRQLSRLASLVPDEGVRASPAPALGPIPSRRRLPCGRTRAPRTRSHERRTRSAVW